MLCLHNIPGTMYTVQTLNRVCITSFVKSRKMTVLIRYRSSWRITASYELKMVCTHFNKVFKIMSFVVLRLNWFTFLQKHTTLAPNRNRLHQVKKSLVQTNMMIKWPTRMRIQRNKFRPLLISRTTVSTIPTTITSGLT